jgi:multiple sugar transport system ATP-binding protein
MSRVSFRGAECRYPGAASPAVAGLDLEIADGEFLVLVGPSGCGKSTTLRMLAGLEEVTAGEIYIGADEVTQVAPKDRDIALVFQSYALYPHMTVAENIGFSLKMAGVDKAERGRRVDATAHLLDIESYLQRKPKELSGGQRQRVAMGRALVREPAVFCMDEPLSNLDAKLRVSTRTQIAALQHRLGITTVYVTHDQVEAMTLGDRVAVMKDGVLQQVDDPLSLYDRPVNLFVAGFIGSPAMNLMPAPITDGHATIAGHPIALDREALSRAAGPVTLGLRPDALRISANGDAGIPVRVKLAEELGSDSYLYGVIEGDDEQREVVVRAEARGGHQAGDLVHVGADPAAVHVFDTASGVRL